MTFVQWLSSFKFTTAILDFAVKTGMIANAPKRAEAFDAPWYHHHLVKARASLTVPETEGQLLVLRSEQMPKGALFDHNLGWRDGAKGRVSVREASGTHVSILSEANAPAIANIIEEFLGDVRGRK
jgi:thioesterase domain-containing protein